MKQSDMPAFPLSLELNKEVENGYYYSATGLTKREYFAAMAMQGIESAQSSTFCISDENKIAERAVMLADLLLAKLEEKGEES